MFLDHFLNLSDDIGIFQHCNGKVPNLDHGYCSDDVSRALIVATRFYDDVVKAERKGVINTYIKFLREAQVEGGLFRNFRDREGLWLVGESSEDCLGRCIWGLGEAQAHLKDKNQVGECRELLLGNGFNRFGAVNRINDLMHLRSKAYAVLGLVQLLDIDEFDRLKINGFLEKFGNYVLQGYEIHRSEGWVWCEDRLTYDNARVSEALLAAGKTLEDPFMVDVALKTLDFFVDVVREDGKIVLVGNNGWLPKNGEKSKDGEQPIDAESLVSANVLACEITGDEKYKNQALAIFSWFGGDNQLGEPVAEVEDGACHDGVDLDGRLNANCGAESTLSYLLALSQIRKLKK